jgi:hypothetical protein
LGHVQVLEGAPNERFGLGSCGNLERQEPLIAQQRFLEILFVPVLKPLVHELLVLDSAGQVG